MYEIACRFMGHMSQKKGFSEKITQFQQYIRDYRFLMIGILFIIPVMPDEIICAGAAVTGIKRSQLLSVAVCGKAVSIGMVVWGREIGQIFALNQYEVMGIEIVLLLLAAKLFQKRHPYEGEKCM